MSRSLNPFCRRAVRTEASRRNPEELVRAKLANHLRCAYAVCREAEFREARILQDCPEPLASKCSKKPFAGEGDLDDLLGLFRSVISPLSLTLQPNNVIGELSAPIEWLSAVSPATSAGVAPVRLHCERAASGGGFVPLSGRSWPDTPQEALARVIFLIILAAVVIPAACWVWWWFNTNRPSAYRRGLERESAEFRVRWPDDQLSGAPYRELDKEAQRCWSLLLLLEERQSDMRRNQGSDSLRRTAPSDRHRGGGTQRGRCSRIDLEPAREVSGDIEHRLRRRFLHRRVHSFCDDWVGNRPSAGRPSSSGSIGTSRKSAYRELALLYTHSSAFWARWRRDRLGWRRTTSWPPKRKV